MKEAENKATVSETGVKILDFSDGKAEYTLDIRSHFLVSGYETFRSKLVQDSICCLITNDFPGDYSITAGAQSLQMHSNQNLMILFVKNESVEIRSTAQNGCILLIILEHQPTSSLYQHLLSANPYHHGEIPGILRFNTPGLRLAHTKISEIKKDNSEAAQFKRKSLLCEIVASQCETLFNQQTLLLEKLGQNLTALHIQKTYEAKKIIDSNLTKNYTIPDLALLVGTNEQYLKRHFKLLFAQTISCYKTSIKMEYAKKLILQGDYQIWEVASMVGFHHATHFTSVFKKYFGLKPKDLKLS